MSDDFLRDLEGQLRTAAERRRPRPLAPRIFGGLLAAAAVAAVVAVFVTGADTERDAAPAVPDPAYPVSDCGSPELSAVAPAFGLPRSADPPRALRRTEDEHGLGRDMARRVLQADGVSYWVVPELRCEHPDVDADRVCMVPVLDTWDPDAIAPRVCATPDEIRRRPVDMGFPVDDGPPASRRLAVAGLAPPGAGRIAVRGERGVLARLPVIEGAFGGVVDAGPGNEIPPFETEVEPLRVVVLPGGGDVDAVADRLSARGLEVVRDPAESPSDPVEATTRVFYTASRAAGEDVARWLGLPEDAAIPVPDDIREVAPGADVFVTAGPS